MTSGIETRSPGANVVELREDVPLKSVGGGGVEGAGWGGPRGIVACFAVLTAGITLALFVQIWGAGGGTPEGHGAVAAGGGALCSRAGASVLRAGGGALDAAAATALCLAVAAPHATSLDASGELLLWQYRTGRDKPPLLVRWGAQAEQSAEARPGAPPRLVCALAALHAGAAENEDGGSARLPWRNWIQPAFDLAISGVPVTPPMAAAVAAAAGSLPPAPPTTPGTALPRPRLSAYLERLQNYTSLELSQLCGEPSVVVGPATGVSVGRWRVWGSKRGAAALGRALEVQAAPLADPALKDMDPLDAAIYRAALSLNATNIKSAGPGSGLAVVDSSDTYIALVTGLSTWFGSSSAGAGGDVLMEEGGPGSEGWTRDRPAAPLDLAPAILYEGLVCGTRYILGAESISALAQAGAALSTGAGALPGVERARLTISAEELAEEQAPAPPAPPALARLALGPPAPPPHAAVHLVAQSGDDLASHADSRAASLASRF